MATSKLGSGMVPPASSVRSPAGRAPGFRLTATGLVVAGLAIAGCASSGHGPASPAPPPPAPAGNPWAEPARDVLVQHCGRCHRSDLDTALKGALAVFDLTEAVWHARLRPDQHDDILERVRETSAVLPEDVAVVKAFVGCARGGACIPPPGAGTAGQ